MGYNIGQVPEGATSETPGIPLGKDREAPAVRHGVAQSQSGETRPRRAPCTHKGVHGQKKDDPRNGMHSGMRSVSEGDERGI
jgi:hypothetical protein